jgi:hypothetical protein
VLKQSEFHHISLYSSPSSSLSPILQPLCKYITSAGSRVRICSLGLRAVVRLSGVYSHIIHPRAHFVVARFSGNRNHPTFPSLLTFFFFNPRAPGSRAQICSLGLRAVVRLSGVYSHIIHPRARFVVARFSGNQPSEHHCTTIATFVESYTLKHYLYVSA